MLLRVVSSRRQLVGEGNLHTPQLGGRNSKGDSCIHKETECQGIVCVLLGGGGGGGVQERETAVDSNKHASKPHCESHPISLSVDTSAASIHPTDSKPHTYIQPASRQTH